MRQKVTPSGVETQGDFGGLSGETLHHMRQKVTPSGDETQGDFGGLSGKTLHHMKQKIWNQQFYKLTFTLTRPRRAKLCTSKCGSHLRFRIVLIYSYLGLN